MDASTTAAPSGRPTGRGLDQNGWLRCPWHGYDYSPHDGKPPLGFDDAATFSKTEVRQEGGTPSFLSSHLEFVATTPIPSVATSRRLGSRPLMSGYLGSIGFGFPTAMGAWAAVGNDRPVISISGDGGFGQYAMEMTTAVKYGMNNTHILLNNSELAKISKEQRTADFDVWQTGPHNPNSAAFAELCGAHGVRVTDRPRRATAVGETIAYPDPALVEIVADPLLM